MNLGEWGGGATLFCRKERRIKCARNK